MRSLRLFATAVMVVLVLSAMAGKAAVQPKPSATYEWLNTSLEATARELDRHEARPAIISRTPAIALAAKGQL